MSDYPVHVMKMYGLLYCNTTYRDFTTRAGSVNNKRYIPDWEFGNRLTDAALECCGHPFYAGAVARLNNTLVLAQDEVLKGLAIAHLLNFATEEHIIALGMK